MVESWLLIIYLLQVTAHSW